VSRIELELYADRVARHAERLRDDVDGAHLRLAWAGIEGRVRTELGAHDAAVLEALGVLVAVDAATLSEPINLEVHSTPVNLALVEGLTGAITKIGGTGQVDVTVKNTVKDPQVDGTLRLIGGAFTTRGVQVLWPKKLYPQLQGDGLLSAGFVAGAAREAAR